MAASVIDFDGALSCTKQEGLTLMEEQKNRPRRESLYLLHDRPSEQIQCNAHIDTPYGNLSYKRQMWCAAILYPF